jgi:hypothetical protein
MELSKRYQPSEVEGKLYHFWEEGQFFRAAVGVVSNRRPMSQGGCTWAMPSTSRFKMWSFAISG